MDGADNDMFIVAIIHGDNGTGTLDICLACIGVNLCCLGLGFDDNAKVGRGVAIGIGVREVPNVEMSTFGASFMRVEEIFLLFGEFLYVRAISRIGG